MGKFSPDMQLYAIVVGSSADEFVCYTMNLLGDYGLKFILCDDIYRAVGELAKNRNGNVLVIGRVEQLSREHGRFFQKVSENGFSCCCLADAGSAHKRKQILAVIETGAFVVNEPAEIGEVVTKLLDRAPAFIEDEF
ncbi:unnamed protein product, partial [marine sediment metagenome]